MTVMTARLAVDYSFVDVVVTHSVIVILLIEVGIL